MQTEKNLSIAEYDALIVVDVQNDFLPGGALAVNDGEAGTDGAANVGTVGSGIAGGTVTVNFNGAAAQTVTGAVTAAADNEGIIVIANSTGENGTADVTFSSTVGSSTAALTSITTTSGDSKFSGDVFAKTITSDATATAAVADFDGNVTAATAFNIGSAGTTFAGNVTAGTLFVFAVDAEATAAMTFDGGADQTITGAITTANTGVGNITVSNAVGTVTFGGAVGATGVTVNDISLATASTTLFEGAIFADTLALAGTASTELRGAAALDLTLTTAVGNTITLGNTFIAGTTAKHI